MESEKDRKRLERQARSLILTKDISAGDRDIINSLMRNQGITFEERYTSIIDIVKKSPDKKIEEIEDAGEEQSGAKKPVIKKTPVPRVKKEIPARLRADKRYPDINGPTETKLYIDEIYYKFKKYRLFRKRYLARRANRFGIGWSKRLMPSKNFLMLMNDIRSFQENILSRLPGIFERILKDESADSPLEFNYLRMLRRWMIISPLTSVACDRIKWMEQWDYEREFRSYTVYFHSFQRIETGTRDRILAAAEKYLRDDPELVKEEPDENDERSAAVRKENDNYLKEKYIFEYLGALRSFISIHDEPDSLLAAFLKNKYGLFTLEETLNNALEALVFQRPFTGSELREYFEITPPSVSPEVWDLSQARLKLYGKDPESIRLKRIERLEKELAWFDAIGKIVKIEENGRNMLVGSAEEFWKSVERVNRDGEETLKNNFIIFLEGLVSYFNNLIAPLLDGQPLLFDYYGDTVRGAIFSADFFSDELTGMESLAADILDFRSSNPTLKITDEELRKIVAGRISSMDHVEDIISKAGRLFYETGNKLYQVYNNHISAAEKEKKTEFRTIPLRPDRKDADGFVPYSKCLFRGFEHPAPLQKRIEGRKILSDSMKGGVLVFIIAFCYQASSLCGHPRMLNDLARGDIIRRQVMDLKGEKYDIKR